MVHIGEPDFYRRVYDDAFSQDVVLVEGVRSPFSPRITRVYRWIVGSKRLGLSLQPPYPKAGTVKARIVHADLSGRAFGNAWAKVPFWMRWTIYIGGPLYGIWMRLFGTREMIAKRQAMEDLRTNEEMIMDGDPDIEALNEAMLDARDARFVEHLKAEIDAPRTPSQHVAVVCGAAHVRAIIRALSLQCGYVARDGEWMTVFTL